GNALFYIDGILDATRDISSQNGSLNNSIVARIGMYSSGNTWPFNGLIDEVRVYNRALSASEVKVLYNMGR
ncbi:MAG: LamG-like jellyroll fold domain-containing protein, partial [Patescibacteria group bacterium]